MSFTRHFTLLLLFSLLGIFVLYPTGTVLYQSLLVKGSLSVGNYEKLFANPRLFQLVWGSVRLALRFSHSASFSWMCAASIRITRRSAIAARVP